MTDYYYEYFVKLDDGSYLSYNGDSCEVTDLDNDRRAFFRSRDLAHMAGRGFAAVVKDESDIEITFSVESIVRYRK